MLHLLRPTAAAEKTGGEAVHGGKQNGCFRVSAGEQSTFVYVKARSGLASFSDAHDCLPADGKRQWFSLRKPGELRSDAGLLRP